MLKTIKVKKQLRLDELIKYIRDNRVREKTFRTNEHGNALKVDEDGLIDTYFPTMHLNNSFTVEVEEEITEDTVFDSLIEITADGGYIDHGYNISISDVKNTETLRFYALIDKKLQLIWEAE